MNNSEIKAIARNSMLEKLQSKIKQKNIKVEAMDYDAEEEMDDAVFHSHATAERVTLDEYSLIAEGVPFDQLPDRSKFYIKDEWNSLMDMNDEHYKSNLEEVKKEQAARESKASVLDSYLEACPLFAVAEVDGGMVGGVLATVMAEIEKAQPSKVEFKIVTTDENAAKAFFKSNPEKATAAPKVNEMGTFWFVHKASGVSEMEDVVWSADLESIMLQTKGGLEYENIVGIFKKEEDAKKMGEELLKEQTKPE